MFCVVCRDLHNSKPIADTVEGGLVGVANPVEPADEPPAAMEPADEPRGLPTSGDSEEEEGSVWNVAHKKYQEFQQTCGDLLDPGEVMGD